MTMSIMSLATKDEYKDFEECKKEAQRVSHLGFIPKSSVDVDIIKNKNGTFSIKVSENFHHIIAVYSRGEWVLPEVK